MDKVHGLSFYHYISFDSAYKYALIIYFFELFLTNST